MHWMPCHRSKRRGPGPVLWVLGALALLALVASRRASGHEVGVRIFGHLADNVTDEEPADRIAELVFDRDLADDVTDEELDAAWSALRKRAAKGRPDAVAALFALADLQRGDDE